MIAAKPPTGGFGFGTGTSGTGGGSFFGAATSKPSAFGAPPTQTSSLFGGSATSKPATGFGFTGSTTQSGSLFGSTAAAAAKPTGESE